MAAARSHWQRDRRALCRRYRGRLRARSRCEALLGCDANEARAVLRSSFTGTRPGCWSSAALRRHDEQRRGLGKPETFTFLGFIFICGKTRRGAFQLLRKTRGDRMMARLKEIKAQLRERMHDAIPEQGKWLKAVVTGYFAYHAVPTNLRALRAFRYHVTNLWRRTLRRRSQKDGMTWDTDDEARCTLATDTPNPSSMAGPALCRQTPEVGAGCPNRARPDLCGGCPVTGIPTAIIRRVRTTDR